MRTTIPDQFARCNHCLTIPPLEKHLYGILDKECSVCGAEIKLFSACHLQVHNPIVWYHGKEDFLSNQKKHGFGLLESQGLPKFGFTIISQRLGSDNDGTTVLRSCSLFSGNGLK